MAINVPRSRYRAWRFLIPGLDAADDRAGIQLGASGGVAMAEGNESVRQALLLLFSTRPGERVMRPDYGCDIHRLLFAPNDDTTAGLAIFYVRRAIQRWEPRIDVLFLDAGRDRETPELLTITLQYRVRATNRIETLTFALNLVGEDR